MNEFEERRARKDAPREPVDTGLDENEAELGVLVLAELGKVGADRDGLLDDYRTETWSVEERRGRRQARG